jgi:ABC-type Mn2+/Zn2+ transport system permease subunit
MGAVVASLASSVPFLVTLSLHKAWTFSITALILMIAGWVLYRPGRVCPTDPEYAKACNIAYQWNTRFFWGSVVIWCIGSFSAFILPLLQSG